MKVFFDTVGCRLNQAEIEEMAGKLRQAGHEIVGRSEEADTVVINSCAVTTAASSDSRQKVRQAYHQGVENIILTGCWATLYPQQAAALEGVSSVVNNIDKMNIPAQLLNIDDYMMELEPISRKPLPGVHHRTRAFIKVQDGCDNFCTYCVTRLARGKAYSIPKADIKLHIDEAVAGGTKEIVLTGVNLGSWGKDFDDDERLSSLLLYILEDTKIERIRLSSLEPWDIDPAFFDLWQNLRLCPHLHLPLQSGSKNVLQRMARKTTPEEFRFLLDAARDRIPNLAVTTDVIVGFPGETESEFEESIQTIRGMNFNGGHVFKYSKRDGTAAAKYPLQVSGKIARERAQRIRSLFDDQEQKFQEFQVGQTQKVLWEACREIKTGQWTLEGYSENYDRVQASASENRWNKIDPVTIEGIKDKILLGKIKNFWE
jgi:threonylcarbamoyladenosine tRNA methylthiotransferase MtaB